MNSNRGGGRGVWALAWQRYRQDRVGLVALAVVLLFGGLIFLTAWGWVAADWQRERALPYAPPDWIGPAPALAPILAAPSGPVLDLSAIDPLAPRYAAWAERTAYWRAQDGKVGKDGAPTMVRASTLPFGADRLGRDVWAKAVQGTRISVTVGVLAALLATLIGTTLGALAGFWGGRVGDVLEGFYNVFTAIPGILLILACAAVMGRGITSVVVILGLTGWTGVYRLVRAEFMKHAGRDYVRAAEAIGVSPGARMLRHILPNVSHGVLVQLSILVVGFIKYEVILSYLGLGVAIDQVSWGTLLAEAQSELMLGCWWQLATATAFMALFVTAFALMTDALRDALDPRLRGLEA
ncbi:MAG: ABC transporter permease [Leptothrix ochracea]|uniref:ABC transporter permease n=1 Tax=Leptothrix ochracea TaxID=735331 RepID=UPI0034E1B141